MERFKYGAISCGLAVGTILIQLVLFGLFDSYFNGFSMVAQRWLAFWLLVVPPLAGLLVALVGLLLKDRNKVPSIIGTVLNVFIAAFYSFLVSFAG